MEERDLKAIAGTIQEQIGRGCLFMIGAKNYVCGTMPETQYPYLAFRIGRNSKGISFIRVILDEGKDMYTLETLDRRGKVISSTDDVFCDGLNPEIAVATGLATRLEMFGA